MSRLLATTILFALVLSETALPADFVRPPPQVPVHGFSRPVEIIQGHAAVIDGRTLWFPMARRLVRLAGIDSCEIPQWAFDPKATQPQSKALMPVPCGGFAKAWLKRAVGSKVVTCNVIEGRPDETQGEVTVARCTAATRDIALEMVRVGWARIVGSGAAGAGYAATQQYAMTARYGMWATYVLDPPEWRDKAVDRTLGRQPLADRNLLAERRSEISPPFVDARRQPRRRDR